MVVTFQNPGPTCPSSGATHSILSPTTSRAGPARNWPSLHPFASRFSPCHAEKNIRAQFTLIHRASVTSFEWPNGATAGRPWKTTTGKPTGNLYDALQWSHGLDRLEALGVKDTFLGQPAEGKAASAKVTAGPQVPAKELGAVVTALLESGIRVISLEVTEK